MRSLPNQSLWASCCVQNKTASFIRPPNTGKPDWDAQPPPPIEITHITSKKTHKTDGHLHWHTYLWGLLLHLTTLNTDLAKLAGRTDTKSCVIRIAESHVYMGERIHNRVYSRTRRISDPVLKCISILMCVVMRMVIIVLLLFMVIAGGGWRIVRGGGCWVFGWDRGRTGWRS